MFVTYTNRTGSASVKGTIVISSPNSDNAVEIAPANSEMAIGIIYESGVPNGSPVKVVICGQAQVLLKDTDSATHGYWCGVSTTPGRMYQKASAPSTTEHNREIGHSLESVGGGTDVLSWVNLQFN